MRKIENRNWDEMENDMKKIAVLIAGIVVLIAVLVIGTGFQKRTDVGLSDYSIAEDGSTITLSIFVPSPMGYVRGFKDDGGGVRPHYLTFYQTFGGLNSSLGAANSFVLDLGSNDTEIYFNRPHKGYELVLAKDEKTGEWVYQ